MPAQGLLVCQRVGSRNARTRCTLSVHAAGKLYTTSSDLRASSDGLRPEGEARRQTLGIRLAIVFPGGVAQVNLSYSDKSKPGLMREPSMADLLGRNAHLLLPSACHLLQGPSSVRACLEAVPSSMGWSGR